jgi:hypothetical protein
VLEQQSNEPCCTASVGLLLLLLSYLWLLEITQARVRFQDYLFEADKGIKHIHILTEGYNRNLDNASVCSKYLLSEFDCGNCSVKQAQVFPIFTLFPDDTIIALGPTILLSSRYNLNMGNTCISQPWFLFQF